MRDPTQPLSIEADPFASAEPSHPSLAVGTSDANNGDENTRIESPGGRNTKQPRGSTRPPPVPFNPDDPDLRLGSVLGTYRLAELLGKGGMGYVYRAEHVKLGREVALKLLRADYARRRDAVLRFFQEAKTVNRVRHRNIVDVTDFIELDDGTTFIIMELLQGQSLGKWARTGVDLPRALAVLVQICDGLGAAHAVGVVHRDLKPDNVVVVPTSDGGELVKLLDFGVAKLVNRDDEDVGFQTAAGSVIGTPAYMSPEQAGGMAVDHRSDIYSLGAIMYELFCGQPMFRGRSFGEYVRKHLTELPLPPRQTQGGAGIDDRLEQLILRCLAKDPNERFGHILELRDNLLHLLGGDTHPPGYASLGYSAARPMPTTQLPPHMLPSVPSGPTANSSQVMHYSYVAPEPAPTAAPSSTSWLMWIIGGVSAVALGIATAVWYASHTSATEPAPKPPIASHEPTAAPIEPTAAPIAQSIELRFDSLPSGGVYADGHSAELCRTPCAFNIDPKDGGGTQRTFVVRSDGYRDKPVVVDLTAADHAFHVTLEHVDATTTVEPATDAKPGKKPRVPGQTKQKPPKLGDKKPADVVTPDITTAKPNDVTIKSAPKPADPKIDPADTLDPFRHQTPPK